MYQQVGKIAYKKDLTNVKLLLQALGNPHAHFPSVHIAGTNGKGSSAHSLAAIFQTAGYRTGLYTSPHLKSFTERIRINGKEIPEKEVIRFVQNYRALMETVQPSFFEVTVAMAFEFFARERVEIAVVEVGLGGRLDSTNVILPEVSLITNISYDHTDMLGDTLSKIAYEKAGIIKPQVPVVIGHRHPETDMVFENVASEQGAPIYFAKDQYHVTSVATTAERLQLRVYNRLSNEAADMTFSLGGQYQAQNIAGILATVDRLRERGWRLSSEDVALGFGNVPTLTGLKGRWQVLQRNPLCVADTGHNEEAWYEIMKQLRTYAAPQYHFVLGVSQGKDVSALLENLPKDGRYYFCQADVARALSAHVLAHEARKVNLAGEVIEEVQQAYEYARQQAGPNDVVFVGGSSFVVAELDDL